MPRRNNPRRGQRPWQDVTVEAQQHRDASLSWVLTGIDLSQINNSVPPIQLLQNPSHLPQFALDITSLPFNTLSRSLSKGTLAATDALTAFSQTAALAQKTTNCLTELLSPRALVRAAELKTHLLVHGKPMGPLHGIPVSVKSHIGVANCCMASGYIAWWTPDRTASRDALVVEILHRAGAVIHARTTEPQAMMQLECASNLFGVTTNPYSSGGVLSSGGSSGGEAALLAMRGSVLGIGSDVGGSIRVPAAACGVYGLKPTGFRVPTTGWASTPPGADPIPTVVGPMCACLEGIRVFMEVVLAAEPWRVEPALVPLPWREPKVEKGSQLRIGIAWNDGTVLPHPPITRVLEEFVTRARRVSGVEVVEFPLYKLDEAWAIASSLYFTDGGEADLKVMAESGEPVLPLVKWIMQENPAVKKLTREELEYWLEEREEYRLEYAEHWNHTGRWDKIEGAWVDTVDALICPVAPGVATRHGTAKYWAFSAVWNLVDYPALAFPAGKVDKARDMKHARAEFMSLHDKDNWALYDPELFHGMPVGLQIVGKRFEDEKIVAILEYLEEQDCFSL